MAQTLAIRGNRYNGDKVIELLLLLGGSNAKGYDGSKKDYCYYINSKGIIDCIHQENMLITQWEKHTLLSFSEEYGNNPPKRFMYDTDAEGGKILNQEFNEVYNAITTAAELLGDFYMKHYCFNDKTNTQMATAISDMWDKLGSVKEDAHEIAEHYTWDN